MERNIRSTRDIIQAMLRARLYGYLIACCIGAIGLSAVFIMRKEELPGNYYLYFIFPLLFLLPGIYLTSTLYRTRSRNSPSHESLRSTGIRINALVTDARDIPGAGGFFRYTVINPANPSKEYISEPVAGTAEIIERTIAPSDNLSRAPDLTLPLYISAADPSIYFVDVKQADSFTPTSSKTNMNKGQPFASRLHFDMALVIAAVVITMVIKDQQLALPYYILPSLMICYAGYRLISFISPRS